MSPGASENRQWLLGDTRVAIVAGSTTVAAAMTYCFYHLARDRTHQEKIRSELRALLANQAELVKRRWQYSEVVLSLQSKKCSAGGLNTSY